MTNYHIVSGFFCYKPHFQCCRDWLKHPRTPTEMVRESFRVSVSEAVKPFLTGRAERFVDELELFLGSGLNIDAYDRVYIMHLGWKLVGLGENDEDESSEQESAVPYLYILDEDSDEN